MPTSSFNKNFIVSGREQVEMFANAIKESYQESLERQNNKITIRYRELKGTCEVREFMKKWKEIHKIGKV